MKKNYETSLPEGYRAAMVIDAKSKKLGVLLNLAALVITAAVFVPFVFALGPLDFFEVINPFRLLAVSAALIAYLVLHELTHGAAYKLLTKQKLTFGISLTVAFCGVPQIFVSRRVALISLLAPFTLFTLVFGAAALALPLPADRLCAAFLLAAHAGGCAGDLYDTLLFLVKFRDPAVLMNDTGPKQTIFVPCNKS